MGGSLGESRCCSQISPRISALSDPQVTYKRHSTKLNECLLSIFNAITYIVKDQIHNARARKCKTMIRCCQSTKILKTLKVCDIERKLYALIERFH